MLRGTKYYYNEIKVENGGESAKIVAMSRRFGIVPLFSGMFVNVLKPRLLVIDLKFESCARARELQMN